MESEPIPCTLNKKKNVKIRPITLRRLQKEKDKISPYINEPSFPCFISHEKYKEIQDTMAVQQKVKQTKKASKKSKKGGKIEPFSNLQAHPSSEKISVEFTGNEINPLSNKIPHDNITSNGAFKLMVNSGYSNVNSSAKRKMTGPFEKGQNNSNGFLKSSQNSIKPSAGRLIPIYREQNINTNLLPLIIRRAPIQSALAHKSKPQKPNNKNFECPELPRTGLFVPFLKEILLPFPPIFATHENIEKNTTQISAFLDFVKNEATGITKYWHKLVYDMFEKSPYTDNAYDYEAFRVYNNEAVNVDATFENYAGICAGKGAPTRYYPNKARYCERLIQFYQIKDENDTTLIFESRFESGNLRRAVQMYFD